MKLIMYTSKALMASLLRILLLLLFLLVGHCRGLSTPKAVSTQVDSSSTAPCPHYKWLIVGGGIHGVGIAARLVGEGKIDSKSQKNNQLLVVDEHPSLLYSWKERTKSVGMAFLRSSAGFHLDLPAKGLQEFAGEYHQHVVMGKNNEIIPTKTPRRNKKQSKKDLRKAKNNRNKKVGESFVGSDYQRPSLELFNDHCDLVVDKYKLNDYFYRGRVESIFCSNNNSSGDDRVEPARLAIRCNDDAQTTKIVSADNIVLAVGNDDPLYPEWATDLMATNNNKGNENHKISHLLQISSDENVKEVDSVNDDDDDNDSSQNGDKVVVIVGGGISAVHKALQLTSVDNINNNKNKTSKQNKSLVHIVSRHSLREQQFDTHQDWMMTQELAQRSTESGGSGLTKKLKEFQTIQAPQDRREVIKKERVPGTVPAYMSRGRGGLEEAVACGKIHWHVAGVVSANETTNGKYQLRLDNGQDIAADEIILATGLGKRPPGFSIVNPLADETGLPLSPCGYPLVTPSLEWKLLESESSSGTSSKIFVAGGLAELELGPSARNVAGARMAAERIAAAAGV